MISAAPVQVMTIKGIKVIVLNNRLMHSIERQRGLMFKLFKNKIFSKILYICQANLIIGNTVEQSRFTIATRLFYCVVE